MVAAALGASDCEASRNGWLAQPVAATTSLGFVLAAAMAARSDGGRSRRAIPRTVYEALLGSVGVGSWWYHGPQGRGAALAHDATIGALVAYATAVPLVRWVGRRPALTNTAARRRAVSAGSLMGVAGLTYIFGRTTSPVCRPGSAWQLHGAWHLLSAAAFALWGRALWPAAEPE